MAKKANNILELVGDTPVVRLNRLPDKGSASVWAKLESFNPLSVKDRICAAMIEAAEREKLLAPGGTIIEPTSGNTGLGLAMAAAVKGYRLVLTMPDTMSVERRVMLRALGAEIMLTHGSEGMTGAVRKAEELAREKGWFMPQQFKNPANPEAHRRATGPELIEQMEGRIDAFVAGVGTGGTLTGVAAAFKERGIKARIIAVEPAASPVLSGGCAGPHKIQGIGAGFVPEVLDKSIIDEIIQVSNEDAAATARELAKKEGILAGISSGAAAFAALKAARELGEGKQVVFIAPDSGERYLSTGLFE